jgi:hypothetical protein
MIPIYFKNSCAKTCLGEIKFKYAHWIWNLFWW